MSLCLCCCAMMLNCCALIPLFKKHFFQWTNYGNRVKRECISTSVIFANPWSGRLFSENHNEVATSGLCHMHGFLLSEIWEQQGNFHYCDNRK